MPGRTVFGHRDMASLMVVQEYDLTFLTLNMQMRLVRRSMWCTSVRWFGVTISVYARAVYNG